MKLSEKIIRVAVFVLGYLPAHLRDWVQISTGITSNPVVAALRIVYNKIGEDIKCKLLVINDHPSVLMRMSRDKFTIPIFLSATQVAIANSIPNLIYLLRRVVGFAGSESIKQLRDQQGY